MFADQCEHAESVDNNISMDICCIWSFLTSNWECFEFDIGKILMLWCEI